MKKYLRDKPNNNKTANRRKKERNKCWEFFQCNEKECPAYKTEDLRCWLFSGTHCRDEIQGKFLEKMEMCLSCEMFKANMDVSAMQESLKILDEQVKEFRSIVTERDRELERMSMELSLGLSEVFEALKKISSGDPSVRISEESRVELISRLKHLVNLTAEEIGEIVDQSHEFAIELAEHFHVLHKVSRGDLEARVTGGSNVELLESLKTVTNDMIASINREINEKNRAEAALRKAHSELEHRVQERTFELRQKNIMLKKENVERMRADQKIQRLNLELSRRIIELTEANKELDAFNHTISHDLRTHLTIIGGYNKRLIKKISGKLNQSQKEMLDIVKIQTERMESLVQDLLLFSRSGRKHMRLKEIDTHSLLSTVLDELKPLMDKRTIKFHVKTLPSIHADKTLMKQVFMNLISNAVKFTSIRDVAVIKIGYVNRKDEDVFYVQDNGVGLDLNSADKLFKVFHRLPLTKEFEGTGVGLSIIQRIIKRHGGRVWATGKVNEGATFFFSLPK